MHVHAIHTTYHADVSVSRGSYPCAFTDIPRCVIGSRGFGEQPPQLEERVELFFRVDLSHERYECLSLLTQSVSNFRATLCVIVSSRCGHRLPYLDDLISRCDNQEAPTRFNLAASQT